MSFKDFKKKVKKSRFFSFVIYILKYKIVNPIIWGFNNVVIGIKGKTGYRNKFDLKLRMLKDTHPGESCIIAGNGPSARFSDFDRIEESGMDSFAANRIIDIFDRTKWRPDYVSVMESAVLTGAYSPTSPTDYVKGLLRYDISHIFINRELKYCFSKDLKEKIYLVHSPLALYFSDKMQKFSEDPSLYVSDLGGVIMFSIQLAVYMGYKKIYLYGIDNSFLKYYGEDKQFHVRKGQQGHMEGMKKTSVDIPSDTVPKSKFDAYVQGGYSDMRKISRGFRACKDYAVKHDIEIINLTRGGELETFKRESFDNVFNNEY